MVAAVIIWIGETKSSLFSAVEKKYTTTLVRSGRRGIEEAQIHAAKLIIVDADSLKMTGTRIIYSLRATLPDVPLILITHSTADATKQITVSPTVTARQLLAHIKRLLVAPKSNVVTCGDFTLDLTRRLLHVRGQEIAVNPKQCKLLEVFFTRPNTTIERATLMKEVWDTDYLGDTRTLDVHIRWLREKLEGATREHGSYLVTVRGVGYRLVVG